MPLYFRLLVPSFIFSLLCAYVAWEWVRWFRPGEKVAPKWRGAAAVVGLCFATFSNVLSVFLFVHAILTGGYRFYRPPVELFASVSVFWRH
jgi:hypothetical protein